MILNHIPQRARLVVVARPCTNAKLFGNADLNGIDPVTIPERLEDGVTEAEDQQVLHGLFSQVVVDPVDLVFSEIFADETDKLTGGCPVIAERFFDYDSNPSAALVQACAGNPRQGVTQGKAVGIAR